MSASLLEVHEWTVAAVEALPETGQRYEILSAGVLTVSPSPALRHQRVSRRLANLIETAAETARANVEVVENINLVIPEERLAIPDVAVVDGRFAATNPVLVPPERVLLVVEIVSPGSEPADRLVKPGLYAGSGIRWYWRFELQPTPHLVVTDLASGAQQTAAAGTVTALDGPFPVALDPAALAEQ